MIRLPRSRTRAMLPACWVPPGTRTPFTLALIFALAGCGGGGSVNDPPSPSPGTETDDGSSTIPMPSRGLDFPGSAAVNTTMRFRFRDPLPIYPATYIWRAYPRQQAGYYTAFFWGNDDGQDNLNTFLWDNGAADSYYGAHPYPDPPPDGEEHDWEISIVQNDFVNGRVVYDQWYTQAFRAWGDANGKHHEFYWNLPNADDSDRVTVTVDADWGEKDPPAPALTWGDAPWAPGNEVWNGVLTGIQVYAANLSLDEIRAEIEAPLSTKKGAATVWYLNLEPTPEDISDQSGRDNHPEWVGTERPGRWVK